MSSSPALVISCSSAASGSAPGSAYSTMLSRMIISVGMDAVFGKVDTEAQPEVAAAFNISSIPTLMIVRDGIVLYAQPGALPEAALEQLITKASELDMDEVRASLATPAEA